MSESGGGSGEESVVHSDRLEELFNAQTKGLRNIVKEVFDNVANGQRRLREHAEKEKNESETSLAQIRTSIQCLHKQIEVAQEDLKTLFKTSSVAKNRTKQMELIIDKMKGQLVNITLDQSQMRENAKAADLQREDDQKTTKDELDRIWRRIASIEMTIRSVSSKMSAASSKSSRQGKRLSVMTKKVVSRGSNQTSTLGAASKEELVAKACKHFMDVPKRCMQTDLGGDMPKEKSDVATVMQENPMMALSALIAANSSELVEEELSRLRDAQHSIVALLGDEAFNPKQLRLDILRLEAKLDRILLAREGGTMCGDNLGGGRKNGRISRDRGNVVAAQKEVSIHGKLRNLREFVCVQRKLDITRLAAIEENLKHATLESKKTTDSQSGGLKTITSSVQTIETRMSMLTETVANLEYKLKDAILHVAHVGTISCASCGHKTPMATAHDWRATGETDSYRSPPRPSSSSSASATKSKVRVSGSLLRQRRLMGSRPSTPGEIRSSRRRAQLGRPKSSHAPLGRLRPSKRMAPVASPSSKMPVADLSVSAKGGVAGNAK